MISQPYYVKHYRSAKRRFLQSSIERFFQSEFPKTFGPIILEKISQKVVEIVEEQLPKKDYLRPGQCIWNAVSIRTRPDHPNCQFMPVILTLVDPSDVEELAAGTPVPVISRKSIARITREAYEQGALLSMRDIGLLMGRGNAQISEMRIRWESEHNVTLPHVGSLQDFGTCMTHKTDIVRKVVYEKKDPIKAADETKHTQKAVDRYLKDFYRVRTCYQQNNNIDFICQVTGFSKSLVKQYIQIISENEKKP